MIRRLGVLLFPGFELLDVFGPLEMFGNLKKEIELVMIAESPEPTKSAQGPAVAIDATIAEVSSLDMLLVPGGYGTREGVANQPLLDWIAAIVPTTEVAMTVCTGTALFVRAGVIDGVRATTNKMAFKWVAEQGPNVEWVKEARWVMDGKFATSSGVSAGMDMALAVIEELYGTESAERLALITEYEWHRDASWDPFAKAHGLV